MPGNALVEQKQPAKVDFGIHDRPMPHNREAESAVLGCMLLDPANAIDVATSRLNFPGSFYDTAHQQTFRMLLELSNSPNRSSIDLITLTDALEKAGRLEEAGGRSYLMQLLNAVPTAANVEHYVRIVHDTAVLRRLINTSSEMLEKCFEPHEDLRELLDYFESEVTSVTGLSAGGGTAAVRDIIMEVVEYVDKLHKGDQEALGVRTGFPDLDRYITGLRPGDMFVLAARPSIGKTALALNIGSSIALRDAIPVGIFSLEMSTKLLVLRMLCSEARVSLSDIKEGAISTGRWHEIMEAGQRLKQAPIYIDDTGGLDIVELRARARRMKREHDIQILIIDYLQLLRAEGNRNSTRENEVSKMSGGIKALAKELDIPIIVLAQLNRQAEQPGQRPRLAHLRESGAIEQDADVVALLHREREIENEQPVSEDCVPAELIIAKHRNGPTGVVELLFLGKYTRFESKSRIPDEDVPPI